MRQLYVLLSFVICLNFSAHSQKIVKQSLDVQGKTVEMKFQFADTISIEASDKNKLELQVSVNIGENRYNDYYDLKIKNQGNTLVLNEVVDFAAIQKVRGENNNLQSKINYKLKVPSNLEFSLNTISGQVVMKGLLGKMNINSISGFIDYAVPSVCKAHINLATVTGNVYSDLKFEEKPGKEVEWIGTKRKLSINGGSQEIALKTVSGDIYLRKEK